MLQKWTCCNTLCLKKVPTFWLSVTLSNLNRFSKFLHCWKRMKFATEPMWYYQPRLRHVATLPWEIKNSNFRQTWKKTQTNCIFNRLQLCFSSIISVFKIANIAPYWLQIKFSLSLFFYLFTFAINLWYRKFVTTDVTAVFVSNQHVIPVSYTHLTLPTIYSV